MASSSSHPAPNLQDLPDAGVAIRRTTAALERRLHRLVTTLAEGLSAEDAYEALSEASDLGTLSVVLSRARLAPQAMDPALAEAYARGLEARERMVNAEGGCVSAEALGRLVGISRQAVDKRRRSGRLLAVRASEGGDWLYPVWQVDERGAVVAGLESVLEQLQARGHDSWSQMIFFLEINVTEELTALQALKDGKLDEVMRAARMYGEQGAW